jgi:hypothetical protein
MSTDAPPWGGRKGSQTFRWMAFGSCVVVGLSRQAGKEVPAHGGV